MKGRCAGHQTQKVEVHGDDIQRVGAVQLVLMLQELEFLSVRQLRGSVSGAGVSAWAGCSGSEGMVQAN